MFSRNKNNLLLYNVFLLLIHIQFLKKETIVHEFEEKQGGI